jgi:hypothetical protein
VNNKARPKVRAQIDPRALAIISKYTTIPEGYTEDGAPTFTGLGPAEWQRIAADKHYQELLAILSTDYPTFAALVQKIWAKRVGRLVPFIFNKTQVLAWERLQARVANRKPMFMIYFKARQMGISTLVNGLAHWHIWRLHDIEVALVAHEKPLVYSFLDRLRIFHEELPQVAGITRHLRQPSKEARVPREEMFYRETRSKIATVVAKNAQARGRSCPHYHLAEYAFYEKAGELLSAIMPQLPAAGTPARLQCTLIVESTPNGQNDFYELWRAQSESERSDWDCVFLPWMVLDDEYSLEPPPGYGWTADRKARAQVLGHIRAGVDGNATITLAQLYWYEDTLEAECEGNQDRMDREYPSDPETAFLLRSRGIFRDDMRYLQATRIESERRCVDAWKFRGVELPPKTRFVRGTLEYKTPDNPFGRRQPTQNELRLKPKFARKEGGDLCVWEPPHPEHEYVIGMDVAAGTFAGDYSCAEVLDVTEGRQVAELHYRKSPEDFTDDCVALGYWYNTALLYPEINSIGSVCMKRAKQVWFYPRLGREEKWDEIGVKPHKYGHYTTFESKQIMVSFFKHVVEQRYLAIASEGLLAEMSTYIETGDGDFRGDGSAHDDRVAAMYLALAVVRQSPRMLAGFSQKPHEVKPPDAVASMINTSPRPEPVPRIPQEVRALLDGTSNIAIPAQPIDDGLDVLSVPANPIRGVGIDLPW